MSVERQDVSLANWREFPQSQWSFHHVDQLIPTESISASSDVFLLKETQRAIPSFSFQGLGDSVWNLDQLLSETETDAFCVLHRGALIHEWYADHYSPEHPHIVYSVSKSITATLAGVLVGNGRLNPAAKVTDYVPEIAQSAYADCTVQHVLDMTVSTSFEEDYTATQGDFVRYRAATAWNPPTEGSEETGLHGFLTTIGRGTDPHGYRFRYRSPNSDLLGWIIERAGGQSLAQLLSKHLWQPMGAERDAYITVDNHGASRSAGGICATPHDLLRFGELMRMRGQLNGRQIIPQDWVTDCVANGDRAVWTRGDFAVFLPQASYRNKWYQTNNHHAAFFALGIHGQWIYIDPIAELVIVKLSSGQLPADEPLDLVTLRAFEAIASALQ